MDSKALYDRWANAHAKAQESGGAVYLGFYPCKATDTYIALDEVGNEYLFVTLSELAVEVFERPKLLGIEFDIVENKIVDSANKVLQISMAPNAGLKDAFEAFCVTLVTRISSIKDDVDIPEEIFLLSKEYADFFSRGGKTSLSPIEEQGLFGELVTLRDLIDRFGDDAIDCWVGQDKNRHDFVFQSNDAIEVKTSLKLNRRIFTVSSDVQLEVPAGSKLFLKLMLLEKNPSGQTVGDIIEDIYHNKLVSQTAKDSFERKLLEGKVRRQETPAYSKFVMVETHVYFVDDLFPRLTLEKLRAISPRIYSCRYKVDLDGLDEFEGNLYDDLAA